MPPLRLAVVSVYVSIFLGNLYFNDCQISEIFRCHSPVILISIEINEILLYKYRQRINKKGERLLMNKLATNFAVKLKSRFKASG